VHKPIYSSAVCCPTAATCFYISNWVKAYVALLRSQHGEGGEANLHTRASGRLPGGKSPWCSVGSICGNDNAIKCETSISSQGPLFQIMPNISNTTCMWKITSKIYSLLLSSAIFHISVSGLCKKNQRCAPDVPQDLLLTVQRDRSVPAKRRTRLFKC